MIIKNLRDLDALIEVVREISLLEIEIQEDKNIWFQKFMARSRKTEDKKSYFHIEMH